MRHTKIIATLGPAVSAPGGARCLDRGRRRRVPPQLLARHAEPITRRCFTRSARPPRAPIATSPILQDLSGPKIRTGRLEDGRADSADEGRSADHRDRRRGRRARPRVHDLRRAGLQGVEGRSPAAGRRQGGAGGRVGDAGGDPHARDRRRRARRAQGHQRAARAAALGDDREGPARPDVRAGARRRPGRAQLRAVGRRHHARPVDAWSRKAGRRCRSSPSSSGRKRSISSTRSSTPPMR